ncbi:hypothetical protein WJR50_28485 [Catalinimonas sp. 4WD22]|jgi:hypothetical protein|uniref:hypothetical protein n=1 Tax=Catalinimonas locisalis TaxID=3133978 RepID=UPI00310158D5
MKNTKIKLALLTVSMVAVTSCGIQEQTEEKWNQFYDKVEKLDSVIDKETKRLDHLDSLIEEETQRLEKLDSLIRN